jgi:DNA-binding IclR family transcriptional regulator
MRLPEAWFVTRTMRALEILAFSPMSAPELAAALQVHPRTARRLLTRLYEEGYLTRSQDSRRRYAPSMRIVALASQVVAHDELLRRAVPHVARLHERTGGTAHLMVPSYRAALCLVHSANGSGPAQPQLRELVPPHSTAAGKALLGHRDRWRKSVLEAPLDAETIRTITDPRTLLAETEAIRERGYATEDGEHVEGVRAVAAPVFADGEAVAALSADAVEGQSLEDLAEHVTAAAREMNAELETTDG